MWWVNQKGVKYSRFEKRYEDESIDLLMCVYGILMENIIRLFCLLNVLAFAISQC